MSTQNTEVRLSAGGTRVTFEPERGCAIASIEVGGTELLARPAFVMAPWCGRTDHGRFRAGADTHQLPVNEPPHALHGFARDGRWRTVSADERAAAFLWALGDPWPWSGTVTHLAELAEDGASLTLTLGVEAASDSFPAQAGWHPWFRRTLAPGGPSARVEFDPAWQEERGADHLPTGRRVDPRPGPWDDCFGMPDGVDVTLTWPGELAVRVTSRAEWVVLYDEEEDAVCVEPQSGPPNGLNTHPRLVTPIAPLEITTTWSWRRP
ncbi:MULTISPECIES: aldose epimerase family protein [Streptomyces]|uniref:aldose epimerase family protein n=1 Tax=Streptomyces TaxID=1883 RepID=UPI0022491F89|nr:aldose 1-epimerase [Streptomyces sp. JHD 1]MCX2971736.1 aldose 1-epimerase [Streptomyces sp. JHD 1]